MEKEEVKGLVSEAVSEALAGEMASIIKSVKEATIEDKKIVNIGLIAEKSVINEKRVNAPFMQIGKDVKAMIDNFRAMAKGMGVEKAASGQNEATDADGGYLVSEEFSNQVFSYASANSVVRGKATVVAMGKLKKRMPTLDQSGDVFAGVSMQWEAEGTAGSASKIAFTAVILQAFKMIGTTISTSELLEDSDVDLANYLVQLFGRAIAYFEDKYFIKGQGTTQPTGLAKNATAVHRAVATQVSWADLNELEFAVPISLRNGGSYILSDSAFKYIKELKDTLGRPIFSPGYSGVAPATINGYPFAVVEDDRMATLGTKGDVIFGNLSAYYIGDRRDIVVSVSPHVLFTTDELIWKFTKRVDGKPALNKAFAILDVPAGS